MTLQSSTSSCSMSMASCNSRSSTKCSKHNLSFHPPFATSTFSRVQLFQLFTGVVRCEAHLSTGTPRTSTLSLMKSTKQETPSPHIRHRTEEVIVAKIKLSWPTSWTRALSRLLCPALSRTHDSPPQAKNDTAEVMLRLHSQHHR